MKKGPDMAYTEKELSDLIYLYAVTKAKPSRRLLQELELNVYTVHFKGSYAVVSRVSPDEFSEANLKAKLADMQWLERKAVQHDNVIKAIMRETTVIPFKFATIFQSDKNVEKLLKEHASQFAKMLSRLDAREEWGMKIYCDSDKLKAVLEKEDEKIKEIDRDIISASNGKAYLLKKKKEELIDVILTDRISEYTQDFFDRLNGRSVAGKINKLLPREVTQKKEQMVLNTSFLIDKKRINECDTLVASLKNKYEQIGFEFAWTGPWPPYNFCSIAEKRR